MVHVFSPSNSLRAALVCALVIAYLSLVPFDYRPVPLGKAWEVFLHAPLLDLGIFARADWIANLLAYVPLGFFLAATFQGRRSLQPLLAGVLSIGLAALLAAAVEFTQVFFPPRTVSRNDLIAELLGAAIGTVSWIFSSAHLAWWGRTLQRGGEEGKFAVLIAYAAGYLVLSLFPYDFVASASELTWKIDSKNYGLIFAPGQCTEIGRCTLRVGVEVLAFAPIGLLWAMRRRRSSNASAGQAFAVGALLGLAIELGQFFLVSGISQGASVATRAVGFALGAIGHGALLSVEQASLVRSGKRASILLLAPYILMLLIAAGWWDARAISIQEALARVPEFHFIPFYYHYYVPEAHAVASALMHLALYAPVGVGFWLLTGETTRSARWAALSAMLLAALVEASKAFLPGRHPDPTDALIAGAGAWLVFHVLRLAARKPEPTGISVPRERTVPAPDAATRGTQSPGIALTLQRVAAGLILLIVAVSVATFPVYRTALVAGLVAYAILLYRRPAAWLVALPTLLPVLDFAPMSGRFFWDEFDFFVATTVGVRLWIARPVPQVAAVRVPTVAVALLLFSTAVSTAIGLWPLQAVDANSFADYHSHFNALRGAKGVVCAFVLLLLLHADAKGGVDLVARLTTGLALALATLSARFLWERAVFSGLWNFSNEFRATGLLSPMHTGGAYADGFLVLALPAALVLVLTSRTWLARQTYAAIVLAGIYALAVTFSRAPYLGFVVSLLSLTGFLAIGGRSGANGVRSRGSLVRFALLIGLAALVAAPAVLGPYAQVRLAQVEGDFAARFAHWRDAVRMMNDDLPTLLFGMGLATYPGTYFWRSSEGVRPAAYRFEREKENQYLRLGSGDALYFEQIVDVHPNADYTLVLKTRGGTKRSQVTVPVCEKALLDSYNCAWLAIPILGSDDRVWTERRISFNSGVLGKGRMFLTRPIKLALTSAGPQAIDIDDVSLTGPDGTNLVTNGDFSQGMDHWFFSTDNHLPWHIKSLPLQVFFEQGMVGIFAFALLLWTAIRRGLSHGRRNPLVAALLSSLVGFLVVGLFDSLIDVPRHILLLLLLVFVLCLIPATPRKT